MNTNNPIAHNTGLLSTVEKFFFSAFFLLVLRYPLAGQNVGINVPNPFWPLEISAAQSVARLTSTNSTFGSVLELKNSTPSGQYLGEINFNNASSSYPGQIAYKSNNEMSFVTNGQERMVIHYDGDVSIGTTGPGHNLEINGNDASITMNAYNSFGSRIYLYNSDPGANYYGGIRFGSFGELLYKSNHSLTYGLSSVAFLTIDANGRTGLGRVPVTNRLEVEGNASKTSAGDWAANSDARLKKNIRQLDSNEMLEKLLSLQGITYEWNDDKTGSKRPTGIQFGFTAQNIRDVFPTLVEEDSLGYLQTAYGTYDPMFIEALRALNDKIKSLEAHNADLEMRLDALNGGKEGHAQFGEK